MFAWGMAWQALWARIVHFSVSILEIQGAGNALSGTLYTDR